MRKHVYLALLSSLLLWTGLWPLQFYLLSWFAFLPLFLLAFDRSLPLKKLILLIFGVGIFYVSTTCFWIIQYELSTFLIVVGMLGPSFAIYFGITAWFLRKVENDFARVITVGAAWLIFHHLVSKTPFGAVIPEFPFLAPIHLLASVKLIGFSGFSTLLVALNAALALWIQQNRNIRHLAFAGGLGVILILVSWWGQASIPGETKGVRLKVALIQHNLPISGEWAYEHREEIKQTYRALALEAVKGKPDLIIFPLYTNLPEDPLRKRDLAAGMAKETGAHVLIAAHVPINAGGSMTQDGFISVAVLYSPNGEVLDFYQATLGIPSFSSVKEWTAKKYKTLKSPFGKLGILLCYEDTRPEIVRKAKAEGAELLIALSNPGYFLGTPLPRYHLFQDQLRSLESGLPLVRVSANGYSAMIEQNGSVRSKTDLDQKKILFEELFIED